MSSKILLLEDETLFAESLVDLLEEASYEVSHYANGQDALDAVYTSKFDVYLLDINVPLINGLSLLSELREANDTTPAIFLTSHRDKKMQEHGFKSGGDDYIMKPFDNDELLWRIEALVRRTHKSGMHIVGKLRHDSEHQSIVYNDKVLDLSKKEYILLVLFMKHANENVPKELMYDALWSHSESGSDGAIRVYINRLKQLLPEVQIQNTRGLGYKLVC